MHRFSLYVFWGTLSLYLITLFFASYVGVYLTYVAIPVILVFGLILRFTSKHQKKSPRHKKIVDIAGKSVVAIDYWLNETLNVLDKKNMKLSFHESKIKPLELEIFQRKTELIEIEFACTRPENINHVENLLKQKLKIENDIGILKLELEKAEKQYNLLSD